MKEWLIQTVKKYIPNTFEYLNRNKISILKEINNKPRIKDLYVSLTTYGPRIDVYEYSILSILAGSVLPERILIYVPKGFKGEVEQNSKSFLKNQLDTDLIEMIEMSEDLGPHSKYYYSFKDYSDTKDIVICDDDVVYYKNWLKDLYEASQQDLKSSVFAFKVVNVKVYDHRILPYSEWEHCSKEVKQKGLVYAEGVGGVFYRKKSLNKEFLNKEVFMELVPKADDVWLWYNAYYSNAKIKHINPSRSERLLFVIPNSQVVNLWTENTINRRNDQYVEQCRIYFIEKFNMDIVKLVRNQ